MEAYDTVTAEGYDKEYPTPIQKEYNFFKGYIQQCQAPALEVGVGTGRLLLPYIKEGLNVEGFDNSLPMLEILRKKAADANLSPVVYEQSMQTLHLPRKYGLIYIPLYSLQYIEKWDDVHKAVQAFYNHLLPGGTLLVTLNMPNIISHKPSLKQDWKCVKDADLENGEHVRVFIRATMDPVEQLTRIDYRHETTRDKKSVETKNSRSLRWFSSHEIRMILESHGFTEVAVEDGSETSPPIMQNMVTMLVRAKRG